MSFFIIEKVEKYRKCPALAFHLLPYKVSRVNWQFMHCDLWCQLPTSRLVSVCVFFSGFFSFFYAIFKFLRPEHDCYANFTSCST